MKLSKVWSMSNAGSAAIRVAAVGLSFAVLSIAAGNAHAISSKYGCVEVTTDSLNIRDKNSSRRGQVVAVARRGEVLAKRGPTCPIRRFWCPVENAAGVSGWAAKEFIRNVECR